MIALLSFLLAVLASPFRSNSSVFAENALLLHQVIVLRRKVKGRVSLTNGDRWFFVQLYRWFPLLASPRPLSAGTGRLSPLLALEVAVTAKQTNLNLRYIMGDPNETIARRLVAIISRSNFTELSNNIIQKGLAFIGDWSGTVVKSGRHERPESCPAGLLALVGLRWCGATPP